MSLSRASRASRRVKLWLHCHALEGCFFNMRRLKYVHEIWMEAPEEGYEARLPKL
ncbi:hypothetical protein BD309DRAFT_948732 [Dichomitus squalens]|nr:hypothetical protein BD309DRAFT_948732 [Dichomitus squalens]